MNSLRIPMQSLILQCSLFLLKRNFEFFFKLKVSRMSSYQRENHPSSLTVCRQKRVYVGVCVNEYISNHHLHLKRIKTLLSSAKRVKRLKDSILYTLRGRMLFIRNIVHVCMWRVTCIKLISANLFFSLSLSYSIHFVYDPCCDSNTHTHPPITKNGTSALPEKYRFNDAKVCIFNKRKSLVDNSQRRKRIFQDLYVIRYRNVCIEVDIVVWWYAAESNNM